jgi:hypothetical protein
MENSKLAALCPFLSLNLTCHDFVFQVREGADQQSILRTVHGIYNDIGVKDLTVEIETFE